MYAPAALDIEVRIDAVLPQTQCTRCGYTGCRPYAAAIADGSAAINQCPPGGERTIHALATLVQRPYQPLNPANGTEQAARVAWIDESLCIGCARCLAPCPVDAIVGASRFTHTVVADRCTGCELCIAPCPVDCIEMRPAGRDAIPHPDLNRTRYEAHTVRLRARATQRQQALDLKKAAATGVPPKTAPPP